MSGVKTHINFIQKPEPEKQRKISRQRSKRKMRQQITHAPASHPFSWQNEFLLIKAAGKFTLLSSRTQKAGKSHQASVNSSYAAHNCILQCDDCKRKRVARKENYEFEEADSISLVITLPM